MKIFQGFALAFNMLTIVPFFKVHDYFKGINGYAAMFYPLVGFLLGLFLWKVSLLLTPFMPPLHLGVLIFTLWVTLTGALHLDGLSDTIDGLFVQKKRALEVMKDSHVGGMGMTFTFLFLALKLSTLLSFEAYALLPIVLMLSRLNATLAIYMGEYVGGGMGRLAKEELKFWQLALALLYTTLLLFFTHHTELLLLNVVLLLVTLKFFSSRLGGMSGDVYGFLIEVSELFLLNALLLEYYR